jgi:transcriptional regulator with GAF, ATPase, and Fis domain
MEKRAPSWIIWGLVFAFAAIQIVAWSLSGGIPRRPGALVQIVAAWIVMLALAWLASRRIDSLADRLTKHEHAHQASLTEIDQLQTQNAMLNIIARSVDVPLAFQAMAGRIARIVPCDRVGLTLLAENGEEFQTFTARVREEERRGRPRQELTFKVESTAIGYVVRSREPLLLNDMTAAAPEFLDANVLHSAGFDSALILPLVSRDRAVGTLNVVARSKDAFDERHVEALRPIAEIFAVAHVAQQLHVLLGRHRSMELMSELTLSIASEINGALQTIMGHCDLMARSDPDDALKRDVTTVRRQAERIARLLEKMRSAAQDRMNEVAQSMHETGIPSSPEALDREIT